MKEPPRWRPITDAERCAPLDIIRGVALIGVLLVNLHSNFRISLSEDLLGASAEAGWPDRATNLAIATLLEFKAFTLFSLLFGAGLAVFDERAERRGASPVKFLVRRLFVLLLFGLCHLLLIWNGDILTLYAVCGALVLPFLRLPAAGLGVVGVAFFVLPYVTAWGFGFPSEKTLQALATEAARVYTGADVGGVIAFHLHETRWLILPLLIGVLPRTCGLMALGASAWKAGLFSHPDRHTRPLTAIAWIGGAVGGTATLLLTLHVPTPLPPALLNATSSAPLALAYAAGLLLALQSSTVSPAAAPFAAVGRMALTNYLAQSIVLSVLFYGYGFGLYGRIGSAAAVGIGLSLYAAQLAFSVGWLKIYTFGPVEWLWRTLTYGYRQPMRVAVPADPAL